MIQLREYQQGALGDLRHHMSRAGGGHRRLILQAVTGAGKTVMASAMIHGAASQGKVVLFVAHRRELISQASEKLTAFGVDHGLILPGEKPSNLEHVYVGTVQSFTARIRTGSFDPADVALIIFDECFPAGTLVDGKPIESLQVGDMVRSYNHETRRVEMRPVLHLFKKPAKSLVKVNLSNDKSFICTPEHPIAVFKDGVWEYLPALMCAGYNTMQDDGLEQIYQRGDLPGVRQDIHAQEPQRCLHSDLFSDLQSRPASQAQEDSQAPLHWMWQGSDSRHETGIGLGPQGSGLLFTAVQAGRKTASVSREFATDKLRSSIGAHEAQQSHEEAGASAYTVGSFASYGLETQGSGRQRRMHEASEDASRCFGVADGSQGAYQSTGEWAARSAELLQVGHRGREPENRGRGGWGLASESCGPRAGCPQDGFSGIARVDSVEVLEFGSREEFEQVCPGGFVYNIEVEGNHNYFVENTLVHNCHRSSARTYQAMIEAYPNARVIGLTATPTRGDEKGLGDTYTAMVRAISYREAFDAGYLVRPKYYAPSTPDLENVRTRAGDFAEEDLEAEMNRPALTGDIVSHYARICALPDGSLRLGIVFAVNVRHSIALAEAFNSAGILAAHLDGTTPIRERDEVMKAFRAGEITVLVNVGIACEGLDVPECSAVVLACPTKSVIKHLQTAGRALRPCPEVGKQDALILDHAGNTLRLGPVEEYEEWTLEKGSAYDPKAKKKERDPKEITCDSCGHLFYSAKICPQCGFEHVVERAPKDIEVADGELVELGGERRKYTQDEKRRWYAMMLYVAQTLRKKPGYAFYAYRKKFGHGIDNKWQGRTEPIPPDAEVSGWMQHYRIWQREEWKRAQAEQAQLLGSVNLAAD